MNFSFTVVSKAQKLMNFSFIIVGKLRFYVLLTPPNESLRSFLPKLSLRGGAPAARGPGAPAAMEFKWLTNKGFLLNGDPSCFPERRKK